MTRPGVVVLAPIAPAATGNGLAMRVALLVAAARVHHDVHLVIVPVAGHQPAPPSYAPGTVSVSEVPLLLGAGAAALVPWLADPVWRDRLPALLPLPTPVLGAPPALAATVAPTLGEDRHLVGVVALRLSLAPLGLAVAEQHGVPLIVDADDDDAGWSASDGDTDGAEAWERVARLCLPAATLVTAASPAVAADLTQRYRLLRPVQVVANAVALPGHSCPGPPPATVRPAPRLVMVANLTYPPNIGGATWLCTEVMPLLDAEWHLDLIGAPAPTVTALAGARITVHGWVDDVGPHYERAAVVAAAVVGGSGTRIKVLEALARRRPLVATTSAAAGLALTAGVHALIADTPTGFADAVRVAADPVRAASLVDAGWTLVRDQYDAAKVSQAAGDLLADSTRRHRP